MRDSIFIPFYGAEFKLLQPWKTNIYVRKGIALLKKHFKNAPSSPSMAAYMFPAGTEFVIHRYMGADKIYNPGSSPHVVLDMINRKEFSRIRFSVGFLDFNSIVGEWNPMTIMGHPSYDKDRKYKAFVSEVAALKNAGQHAFVCDKHYMIRDSIAEFVGYKTKACFPSFTKLSIMTQDAINKLKYSIKHGLIEIKIDGRLDPDSKHFRPSMNREEAIEHSRQDFKSIDHSVAITDFDKIFASSPGSWQSHFSCDPDYNHDCRITAI